MRYLGSSAAAEGGVGGARAHSLPFLEGGGRQLEGVGDFFVGGGLVAGGQGSGLTHDVTGHVWMLGDRRSPERFVVLGYGGGSRVERRGHGAPP